MDTQTLINVLAWGLVTVGAGLVAALTWFAIRIVSQLDTLAVALRESLHAHDLRIQRLEDWKAVINTRTREPNGTG